MALGWNPPTHQGEGLWVASEHEIYFHVDLSENMGTIGKLNNGGEIIIIRFEFDNAPNVAVYDDGKIIRCDSGGIDPKPALIFGGNCKSGRNKLTVTVSGSVIDSIKRGDVITFNRVDELPEWALEVTVIEEE
jgi:hypothetical protein